MKRLILFSIVLLSFSGVFAQVISIKDARTQGVGKTVTVKGIVTCGAELGALLRYFQDTTAGIAAYSTQVQNLKEGDSIEITGTLKNYNNLLEFDPVSKVTVISSGNTLPAPIEVGFSNAFAEQYEGMLIKTPQVSFKVSGTFSGNTNYKITNGTVEHEVRVVSTTNLVGGAIPTAPVYITGLVSQFNTFYQLLPRYKKDISFGLAPGILTPLIAEDIKTISLTLSFETSLNGSTIIEYGLTENLELGRVEDTSKTIKHSATLSGLTHTSFYYARPISKNALGDSSVGNIQMFSTSSLSSGKITSYFNLKVDTSVSKVSKATQLSFTIDDTLVAYINRAKKTMDLAIYSFDNKSLNPNVSVALNNAFNRGVKIRVVTDGGNKNQGVLDLNAGIPVRKSPTTSTYGLMHNKFLIIDANDSDANIPIVWTGGTNWTDNQMFTDANDVLIIQDQALAKAYTLEFEEMFGGKFGPDKVDNTPHDFSVNGKRVQAYFSPSDRTTSKTIAAISTAKTDLYFSNYVLTRSDVVAAIKSRYYDGVQCAGVIGDTGLTGAGTQFVSLQNALGSKLRLHKGSGIFHHKYYIVDPYVLNNAKVITGSHNFSTAAETRNDENQLIIQSVEVADQYYQEWYQRYKDNGGTFTSVNEFIPSPSQDRLISYFWNGNELLLKSKATINSSQITILNMNGKAVYQNNNAQTIQGGSVQSVGQFEWQKGVYIIQITDINTNLYIVEKLVR